MDKVNCRICKYYYITWEKTFPNGCKAYGIKSLQMPSLVVQKTSGEVCKAFQKKEL